MFVFIFWQNHNTFKSVIYFCVLYSGSDQIGTILGLILRFGNGGSEWVGGYLLIVLSVLFCFGSDIQSIYIHVIYYLFPKYVSEY